MAERICLLTGYETTCNDSCYICGCGGEVALNNLYVPIYNIQRVCDIVKGFECTSIEGEEIAEYIRNELEKMTVCIEKKAADVQLVKCGKWVESAKLGGMWYCKCTNCGKQVTEYEAKQYAYCPYCGAKMDGGADDENK